MKQNIIITCSSNDPLESVCERLPEISKKHNFGVLGVHNLKEKMVSKGVPFERECRVFDVCNPHKASQILSGSMEVSTALPCRISVYEANGETVLATIKPTALLSLFDIEGAEAIANEVQETLTKIMQETAHPDYFLKESDKD